MIIFVKLVDIQLVIFVPFAQFLGFFASFCFVSSVFTLLDEGRFSLFHLF